MHDISEGAHRSGHNRDLLHRLRILLQCAYKCVAHLVVRYNTALFLTENPVLLLLADQYQFHSLKQVTLGNGMTSMFDSRNGSLIHHVSQISAHCAGSRQGNLLKINRFI